MAPPTFDAALGATVLSAETEIPWDLGRLAGSIAFDRRSETKELLAPSQIYVYDITDRSRKTIAPFCSFASLFSHMRF